MRPTRFSPARMSTGLALLANSYFTAFEEDVAITMTSSGGFLVTWETEAGGFIGGDDALLRRARRAQS